MSASTQNLTDADFAALISGRNVIVTHGAATLQMLWVDMARCHGFGGLSMPREARFVMRGPSGTHTLLVQATPLDRLNAHWITFAGHALNQATQVAA